MSDVGTEFTDFLKAYGLSDFYKLTKPSVSDAEINTIFARYKADFDAWRKIPAKYKDAYGRAAPYMIEKAKQDPNFTESDAQKAREEHRENINPYSPIPKDLENHPLYNDLLSHGQKITPAHIAAMKIAADRLRNAGYSDHVAQKVGQESILRDILFAEYKQLQQTGIVSENGKENRKLDIEREIDASRISELELKKADARLFQPERMLMHTLRDLQRQKITKEEATLQVDLFVMQIIDMGRMPMLEEEMGKSLYSKVFKPEMREILQQSLRNNHADAHVIAPRQEEVKTQNKGLSPIEQTLIRNRGAIR